MLLVIHILILIHALFSYQQRLERAKALKAKEKDLVEKRMNLPVPAPAVDKKVETPVEDDFL